MKVAECEYNPAHNTYFLSLLMLRSEIGTLLIGSRIDEKVPYVSRQRAWLCGTALQRTRLIVVASTVNGILTRPKRLAHAGHIHKERRRPTEKKKLQRTISIDG